ncbi:serine carboxypeptidase-like 45 [Prunus avium]|uniref:Carboxypeptidase n=1 Tax=Prunus avium TaxID=42229 RepID=A0A6P5RXS4_PRUAV|nr:serine carboxypeptidase-like 45 [Prunus avium]
MERQQWSILLTICATLIQAFLTANSFPEADKITSLPGQPQVSFQQYAGYVTVDENQQRALFYYFVEAETDAASKPLVLWLNGGPGCSSVGAGAFIEHGPFKPSGDILLKNDFSWNKEANMLYLESPAGVGFSYSSNQSFYGYVDDAITANDNLVFLERWFDKFPEFKNRDFFITGESYGGHYVPELALLVVDSKLNFNLKGIAIGNPLLDFNNDFNSVAEYYWSHGLISDATFESFTSVCNYSQIVRQIINTGTLSPTCAAVSNQVQTEVSDFIDQYDVTLDVCLSSAAAQSRKLTQLQETEKIDVCLEDETSKYLNRQDVQDALHARLIGVSNWTICSDVVNYHRQNLEILMLPVLGYLSRSGIRILVYSGDQDSVIPLTGTRAAVDGLAEFLELNTTVPYRVWFEEKQVAGWTEVYGDVLSFATIRGAGHTAPYTQPERSLLLFSSFVGGKPLPEALTH